jgi:calcyphosin
MLLMIFIIIDVEAEERAVAALQQSIAEVKIEERKLKLAIIVSGRPEAKEAVVSAMSKCVTDAGIVGATMVSAPDFYSLPYVAQSFVKTYDAIIVIAFLTSEYSNTSVYATSISSSLYQLGIANNTPIIPAITVIGSLLEAKAILPTMGASWIQSALDMIDYKVDTTPVVPVEVKPKPVVKPGVTTDVLMDNLRDKIKVSLLASLVLLIRCLNFFTCVKAHGATGITGLGRKFRIVDDNKSGMIELPEFTKVIKEYGLTWSPSQIKSVFDIFDKDKSGSISYDEFLYGVRGQLNDRRKQLVLEAFQILDFDKMGYVDVAHIEKKYDASKHPDVIAGKRSGSEILREFLEVFEAEGEKDGKLTFDEFVKYYGNISASIDLDDYFELMIRNAWHISGGEGWCANTSNRRVLVTHRDGRQTVEEIKNDLGIKEDDKEAMMANLKAQGIKDVVSIDTKGSTDGPTPEATTASSAPAPMLSRESRVDSVNSAAAGGKANNHAMENNRPGSAASSFNPRRHPGGQSSITFG